MKDVQDELGVQRKLWGVAMKPGKPLAFGVRNGTLVFGLPGNPVSAMVSFELFVRPALLRLMGYRKTTRPPYRAIISEDVANSDGRVLRGEGAGLARGWNVARQLHGRSRIGDPPLDGGGERPGIRSRGTSGSAGGRRRGIPVAARGLAGAVRACRRWLSSAPGRDTIRTMRELLGQRLGGDGERIPVPVVEVP